MVGASRPLCAQTGGGVKGVGRAPYRAAPRSRANRGGGAKGRGACPRGPSFVSCSRVRRVGKGKEAYLPAPSVHANGGGGQRGLFVPRIPRYTSIVYVLFGFFFIIFYIVIAIFTLKNKMKDKKKNRRNRSLKLSSGETVKAARTMRSVRLGKD